MAMGTQVDESGDTDELQALFDRVATQTPTAQMEVVADVKPDGDCEELQALFEKVASEVAQDFSASSAEQNAIPCVADDSSNPMLGHRSDANAPGQTDTQEQVFNRIGQMTRQLHDMLRTLGLERTLENTAKVIPDARQRLNYIAEMTEQAASRVLNATDIARPLQEQIQSKAQQLGARWDELYRNELSVEDFKSLAGQTRHFLLEVPVHTAGTSEQLMDIMMAQDFQDLTGQVIKKLVDTTRSLEDELLRLLVDVIPDERRSAAEGLLNGPVIDAAHCADAVSNQEQADELLESLGF